MLNLVLIGLGTNIGNRVENLNACIRELNFIEISKISSIYESDALLPNESDVSWNLPFLNLAIKGYTKLSPEDLLKEIKLVESNLGRPENYDKWSPRIIDIDILLMNKQYLSDTLIVPHREMLNRAFALVPCQEIAPEMIHQPSNKALKELSIDSFELVLTQYKIKS